jgi:hypothetical protein
VPGAARPPQRPRGGGGGRRRPRVRGRLHFLLLFRPPLLLGCCSRGLGYSSLFLWRCRDTGRFGCGRVAACLLISRLF